MDDIRARPATLPRGFLKALALVHRRPTMYVAFEDDDMEPALQRLESFIAGFSLALDAHGVKDEGADLYAMFPDWLARRFGWSMSQGPIRAIRRESESAADAWTRFWSLLWDYCDGKLAPPGC